MQLVQPAGHVELIEREQGAVGRRVLRVVNRARQVVESLFITLERLGGRRLLDRQVARTVILAIDQVARRTDELWRRQGFNLERVEVPVEDRLSLAVADPLAGGQARTPTHPGFGLQHGDLPAFTLQFIRCRQTSQTATNDDCRRRFVFGQRDAAEQSYHYQRTGAQPPSRHFGELRIQADS
ncbi:hypothetical protein D3C78_1226900 [compost metagenome]